MLSLAVAAFLALAPPTSEDLVKLGEGLASRGDGKKAQGHLEKALADPALPNPLKARAEKLLGDEEYSNRKVVVEDWLKKLPANGDVTRGRVTFEKLCAQCHLVGGIGNAVGPDLGALTHRSVEDLASNILDPNMAINPGRGSLRSFAGSSTSASLHSLGAMSIAFRENHRHHADLRGNSIAPQFSLGQQP